MLKVASIQHFWINFVPLVCSIRYRCLACTHFLSLPFTVKIWNFRVRGILKLISFDFSMWYWTRGTSSTWMRNVCPTPSVICLPYYLKFLTLFVVFKQYLVSHSKALLFLCKCGFITWAFTFTFLTFTKLTVSS